MGRIKIKAKDTLERLVVLAHRMRNRDGRRTNPAPAPSSVPAAAPAPQAVDGDPTVDAIRGNQIVVWGLEGVPPHGTLKTVNDGGAELLFEASDEVALGIVSTEPVVFGAGSHFVPEDAFSRASVISEFNAEDDPEAAAMEKLAQMDKQLRLKSLVPLFDGPEFYIPIDCLHSIMTRNAIRETLPCIAKKAIPGSPVDQLAQDIYGRLEKDQGKAKSYRKILAILVLIGKADTILDFVKHGITDTHLPLQKLRISQPEPGVCRPFQLGIWDKGESADPFRTWEYRDIEEFENKQWETLAPFFSRTSKEENSVSHYELSWRRPLPFEIIPDGAINGGNNRAASGSTSGSDSSLNSMKGGHGKVLKVRINRNHHDLLSYRGNEENPAFAIKRLFSADKEAFKNEVNILTRLNRCNDPHLVKLLLTMEIIGRPGKDSSFFLIFPLADSNLRQFWNTNFPHPKGTITATYVRWVAKQFYGLAVALCKLHDLRPTNTGTESSTGEKRAKGDGDGDPFYGIHGDIKPENLLWYKEWVGPPGARTDDDCKSQFGVLQLADFGISRLHHTETRSNTSMRRATKTYAPPEVEWAVDRCSRSFDIWGLGCVFLEFICWLVQGGSGDTNPVEEFHCARYLDRLNRSLEGTIQDTFYRVVKENHCTKFEVNPAVNELILVLRKGASPFVKDMLNIILYDMLVVEPRKTSLKPGPKGTESLPLATSDGKLRITCINLAQKLQPMAQKNDSYFTTPGPTAPEIITPLPQTLTIHESAVELVKRRSMTRSFSIEKNKQGGSKDEQQHRKGTVLDSIKAQRRS